MNERPDVSFLRHTLATLAYRAAKAMRGAPAGFESFRAAASTRTAGQILAHMGDLMDWAIGLTEGRYEWHDSPPAPTWDRGVERFFAAVKTLDDRLASKVAPGFSAEKCFQGPIADALTHVGQVATLRRLAGAGVKGESYYKADIALGRVGMDQAPPAFEFD
jgi:hypothetical protein